MKRKNLVVGICALAFLLVVVPWLIQLFYQIGYKYPVIKTLFDEKDILIFYGTGISFTGTVFLGCLSLHFNLEQSKRNDQLAENNFELTQKSIELAEKNIELQKIMAQKYLPFLEVCYCSKIEHGTNGQCKEVTEDETFYLFMKTVSEKITYETFMRFFDPSNQQKYTINFNFELKNVSDAIVTHIWVEKIQVRGTRDGERTTPEIFCVNPCGKSGIGKYMVTNSLIKFNMLMTFSNEDYRAFAKKPTGGVCIGVYLIVTALNDVKYRELIIFEYRLGNFQVVYGEFPNDNLK